MSTNVLQRKVDVLQIVISNSAPSSNAAPVGTTVIPYGNYSGGTLSVITGSLTTINWYTSALNNGDWVAAYDGSGNQVQSTIAAGESVPVPTSLFGAKFIAGVAASSSASVAYVTLKG